MLNAIIVTFLCLIPLVIWAYIFSYFDSRSIARVRFLFGILSGAASIVPVYLLSLSIEKKWLTVNPFSYFLSLPEQIPNILLYFLLFLLLLIGISLFLSWILFGKGILQKSSLLPYFSAPLLGIGFFMSMLLIASIFPFDSFSGAKVMVAQVTLSSFSSILLYYAFTSFSEETSKWLHGVATGANKDPKPCIIFIFVALGFSFIENIFYTLGPWISGSGSFFGIFLLRSLFSTLLHITCTLFLSKMILSFFGWNDWRKFCTLALVGFVFHMIYNLALSYGQNWILLLLLILGYLLVTQVYYDDRPSSHARLQDNS